jgi:hypothetical protein
MGICFLSGSAIMLLVGWKARPALSVVSNRKKGAAYKQRLFLVPMNLGPYAHV